MRSAALVYVCAKRKFLAKYRFGYSGCVDVCAFVGGKEYSFECMFVLEYTHLLNRIVNDHLRRLTQTGIEYTVRRHHNHHPYTVCVCYDIGKQCTALHVVFSLSYDFNGTGNLGFCFAISFLKHIIKCVVRTNIWNGKPIFANYLP